MGRRSARLALVALVALAASPSRAAEPLPELERRVTDLADLLSSSEEGRLEASLAAYEQSTGHQFALVTLASLDGEPIEDVGIRLAEKWKLGSNERDDGLLFIVAPNDRKMRMRWVTA
ncbi:MAG: hypothetical protein HC923_10230 [Myxococcales bacterium]|nr:hypothetical protein [Myxococcales bacterium]